MQGEAPEPADAPSSPPRWRRLLFWLIVAFGGLLLVILSVVAVWLLTVGRDIPQVDDEDLLLERESIPEKENGYTFLERACETLCIREDFSRNCWLLDPSPDELEESQRKKARELRSSGWAETVLGENREALALVEEVLRCSKMQAALTLDAPLMEVMRLASLLLLRSRHQARQGIDAQSLEDIVNLLGLGRLLRGGNGTLISSLIAQELVEAAHDELRARLGGVDLRCATIRELSSLLGTPAEIQRSFADALRGDYALYSQIIEEIAAGEHKGELDQSRYRKSFAHRFLLKPNRTRQILADWLRRSIQTLDRHYSEMVLPEVPEELTDVRRSRVILSGNPVGLTLLAILIPSLEVIAKNKCTATVSLNATRIHLALACYQQEHGNLPPDLEALVPDYLDAVPIDDYDGKPMRYSAEKKIVYSVGRDLIDSGGEDAYTYGKGDLVYPIEF